MLVCLASAPARAQEGWRFILPEQRHVEIRDPSRLPRARVPNIPPPPTVSNPQADAQPLNLSLDDAIRTALANCDVVRVLAGVAVVASGSTIYDAAVTNTGIDQARGRFDPTLQVQNQFSQQDVPQAAFDPADPSRVVLGGPRIDGYNMGMNLSKTTITGGTATLGVNTNPTRVAAGGLPLNPQTPSSVDLSYTQPLLQGGGVRANVAPLVIARINTELSFFQMKDNVQRLVRGVVEGYWAVVSARTDVWARQQQVDQGLEAFRRAEAILRVGMGNAADVAQSRAAWANFRANLIASQANLLQREAALLNIMGLPPSDSARIVPVSPPSTNRLDPDWAGLLQLAEQLRPDVIELKLIIEADEQQLLLARNQALPQLNATALYRWNGLEGRTPDHTSLASEAGQFTDWQLGVNFSVPLGLRASRAGLRQQEIVVMRDQANLSQGLHSAAHTLAASFRNLAQYYAQYEAYRESRAAATINLERQWTDYKIGRGTLYLNVLQAITDWGNSVSAEAQSLTQYNTELADLEQQTRTILETHGVRFVEERYGSIGPLGRLFHQRCYPRDTPPGANADRYQTTSEPAEKMFNLENPARLKRIPPVPNPSQPPPTGSAPQTAVPEQVPAPSPQGENRP